MSVQLTSVGVSYRDRERSYIALSELDLNVSAGSFVSIVGPTGCGKSTLLNVVAGLREPSSGQVLIDGTPLRGLNRSAGYMFQQDALLPWKTVLDNVAFGLELQGVRKEERVAQARDWVHRVGLGGFENSYPHQLSGGMRKRTAIAQTWIRDPSTLLMDEPFAALDVQTRQLMENELLSLWTGSGKTVLFVTHDLDEAISLSDEVVLLSAGPASRIVGHYSVGLPRPRNLLDMRRLPQFREIYDAVWADLRSEVMMTYERTAATGGSGGVL
ncbi:ABC transporter ATP-binding protein [Streptomyces tendae]|uniref:ABC transporter ATP-binding protein n=1 Tax=Streptomyces tendae TaxID=1932 RepID=UPI00384C74D4